MYSKAITVRSYTQLHGYWSWLAACWINDTGPLVQIFIPASYSDLYVQMHVSARLGNDQLVITPHANVYCVWTILCSIAYRMCISSQGLL